tara:strand:- start:410 stop:805 length:396 start_codon:yes stop_codon:yes gene_type:complete
MVRFTGVNRYSTKPQIPPPPGGLIKISGENIGILTPEHRGISRQFRNNAYLQPTKHNLDSVKNKLKNLDENIYFYQGMVDNNANAYELRTMHNYANNNINALQIKLKEILKKEKKLKNNISSLEKQLKRRR